MEHTLGDGYKRVEHTISEKLSNKLAEVAARKAEEAQNAGSDVTGAQRDGREYYRGPHAVSPVLEQKLAENRERLLAEAQRQGLADVGAIRSAVRNHQPTLSRNLRKAIVKNEYEAVVEDNRRSEIERFLRSVGLGATSLSDEKARSLVFAT